MFYNFRVFVFNKFLKKHLNPISELNFISALFIEAWENSVLFYSKCLKTGLVHILKSYPHIQATKNPFYLHVGKDILSSLNSHTRAECGYATVHDVEDKTLEDRQVNKF